MTWACWSPRHDVRIFHSVSRSRILVKTCNHPCTLPVNIASFYRLNCSLSRSFFAANWWQIYTTAIGKIRLVGCNLLLTLRAQQNHVAFRISNFGCWLQVAPGSAAARNLASAQLQENTSNFQVDITWYSSHVFNCTLSNFADRTIRSRIFIFKFPFSLWYDLSDWLLLDFFK